VDPFQITTFTWVVAGFFILICKSLYVSDWPWHEFLRARVVCRSLSEIRDVTGVSGQLILEHLLHEENRNILRTTGPYNGLFKRKREDGAGGLSIDEPATLETVHASGFVVLKVRNEQGEHLLCLDVRGGGDTAVSLAVSGHWEKGLVSKDVSKDNSRGMQGVALDSTRHGGPEEERIRGSMAGQELQGKDDQDVVGREGVVEIECEEREEEEKTIFFREMDILYTKVLGVFLSDNLFG